jgi:hypothetical protein
MFEVIIFTLQELQEFLIPGLHTYSEVETQVIKDLPRSRVFVGETRVKTLRTLLDELCTGSITISTMRMLTQAVFAVFLDHLHTTFGSDHDIVCSTNNICLQLLPLLHGSINIVVHNFITLETIEKFTGSFQVLDRFVVFELSSKLDN